jgi:uncharacterized protein
MFHFRMSRVLSAPLQVAFPYTRSLGGVLGAFMTGMRDRRVLGARISDDRVVVPPVEYDPVTHAPIDPVRDLVEVGQEGEVVTWTWVSQPVAGQPFERPFAWAMIRLDGADTPMLHAVDAPGPDQLSTGMRVRIAWRDETQGSITDITHFQPLPAADRDDSGSSVSATGAGARASTGDSNEGGADVDGTGPPEATKKRRGWLSAPPSGEESGDVPQPAPAPVTGITVPVELDYTYEASPEESAFFRGLAQGRLLGQRCPRCRKVYIPPRGACPVDGVPTTDEVELPDTGIVTTFCIVNVPFLGQRIKPPYVSAYVLLEGADIAFLHLIQGVAADEVRMGMRVRAVWKPREEWGTTIENILHFEPTGEPDADFDSYRAHL